MSAEKPLPNKLDVARALMLKGSLFIHLDPRVDEVSVPPWLKNQPQLVLQVGLDMVLPIPDLLVDESGVQATLSFNRSPFLCVVPWASVFALVGDDGRGLVWPESMPVEIAAEVDREAQRRGPGSGAAAGGATDGKPAGSIAQSGTGWYFKTGSYLQSNTEKGDAADAVGKVVLYQVGVTHTG